jgi:predicted  nucleic acid-binding Zn-ribbon protein
MCDTSFNAIEISMNEIRMQQLVNKSNINYLSAKMQSLERAQLNFNTQLQQQSLLYQNKFNNLDEEIQRLNKQMFQMQLPKRL